MPAAVQSAGVATAIVAVGKVLLSPAVRLPGPVKVKLELALVNPKVGDSPLSSPILLSVMSETVTRVLLTTELLLKLAVTVSPEKVLSIVAEPVSSQVGPALETARVTL